MSTASSRTERNPLRLRLAALRWRLRLVTVFHGACWVLAAVLGIAALACLLDWLVSLPALIRAGLLAATLTGGGLLAYRYLLAPLAARDDDLTLALRVEDMYPSLNDALASTIQFLDQTRQTRGDSPSMRLEAVRRAMERAKNCDFNRVVPTRGVRLAGLSAGVITVASLALLVFGWTAATTALARFLHPFGSAAWPTRTRLVVEVPRTRLGRGELFVLRGKVEGVIPANATILLREEGFPEKTHVVRIDSRDGIGTFEDKTPEVRKSFRVQVRANDAESEEYAITVQPPPSLVNNSVRLELTPPKYTGLPTQKVEPGRVDVEAYNGTILDLRATADRALGRVWIEYQPDYPQVAQAQAATVGYAAGHPLEVVNLFTAARLAAQPIPATLSEDHQSFHVRFTPRAAGAYQLVFEDETGLPGRRTITVRLQNDPVPSVKLMRPSAEYDLLTVLPTAVLTLQVTADDPVFGLRSVFLRYRTNRETEPRRMMLFDPATGMGKLLGPVVGPTALAVRGVKVSPTTLEFLQPLPLSRFRHPDGSPLQAGDTLILQACADDFDDVTIDKQPGCSPELEIRIISRNQLDLVINQEQADLQKKLVQANDKQREATKKVRDLENKLKRNEKLTVDDMRQLADARDLQQEVRDQLQLEPRDENGNRKQNLRSEVERLREALRQNDMENTGAEMRMKEVARELDRLANNELERIDPRLDEAREQLEMMEERNRQERQKKLQDEAAKQEKAAQAKKAEADRVEQQAEMAKTAEERQKLKNDAEKLRQEAEKLRQAAERTKKQASEEPSPELPRQTLAQARQNQEEVEKTFSDLLQRTLEPNQNTGEVRAEARRLLDEQERLREQMREMEEREKIQGKPLEELKPEQRQQLENMREQQKRIEERMEQLLEKMKRMAEEREKLNDPETARELRETRDKALKDNLLGQMKEAREKIAENKLNDAGKKQEKAVEQMREMVKNLEDKKEAELDRMRKRLKEAEKKLDELTREQEELQKKLREANKKKDPDERAAALKELEGQQKRLRARTKEVMDELKRLRIARAQQALQKADEGMELSRQDLEKGKGDDDKQEDVLDRLDDARHEVEQARKQAEEELKRERMRQASQALTRLKEREETLVADAERIQKEVQQQQKWTRGTLGSLSSLRDNQKGLGEETVDLMKKELTGTPVFRKLVEKAAEAMEQAGKRAEEMFQTVKPDGAADKIKLPDAELAKHQKEALRRLDQVLRAIKEEIERPEPQPGGGGDGPDGGGQGGAMGPEERGLPQQAQLKLLLELQTELKKKTEAFKKEHPDLEKLDEKSQNELESLRKDQQDIYELLDELRKPAGEPGDAEGEKKP
jgi:hypothetical protein